MKVILAIDDQPDNLTTIDAIVKTSTVNCAVIKALSGKEGIELAIKEQPEVILLDIIMPEMDGYEVCTKLKESKLTKHIPIIMITAIKTNAESRIRGLNLGADAFLSKPIDPAELAAQIKVMLRIKSAEDKLRAEKEMMEDLVQERTSELIEREKFLQKSEEKFRKAFMTSPDSININTIDGIYVSINEGFTQICGYSEESVIGKSSEEINIWKYSKDRETLIKGLRKNGKVENLEAVFYRKDKSEVIGLMSASIIELNGQPHILSITRNISVRKRAEQIQQMLFKISSAVIESNDLHSLLNIIQTELGTIIDTTNFYVANYNQEADTLSLPYFSDEKDKLTNIPAGKTLTRHVIKMGGPLLANEETQAKLDAAGVTEMVGKKPKVWLGVPYRIDGKIKGVIAVQSYTNEQAYTKEDMDLLEFIADQLSILIERKRNEESLVSALGKAKEADLLKSAFLANMSHEIRTPMNGIMGFANLLKKPMLKGEKQKEYINIIIKSGDRMLNLINDLIDISKIEAFQSKLSTIETDINAQMEYLYTFFNPEVVGKGMILNYTPKLQGDNAIILTDKEKLFAILSNLIKNAIKYSNHGSIDFGYNLVTLKGIEDELEFYVKDTGIGIPEDKLESIFDRFVQADTSLSGLYEGAGLGLSIAKAYAELLGGRIRVESVEDEGSQFYFTLPYKKNTNNMTPDKNMAAEKITKMNCPDRSVLIADDDDIAFFYLSELLLEETKSIFRAKNGIEAVEICRQNKSIDLILMDIKMPGLNGFEATQKIREFNKDVIIIAQTAFALLGDREKTIEAGCNDYISKPIDQIELLKKISHFFPKE
jgi:PAS domain S-box-containing protein